MKYLLATLLLAPALLAHGAEPQKRQPKLPGIWQQMQKSENGGHFIKLPVWKVLQNDGTFCTFLIANKKGQSIITNEGRYEIVSDTVVNEHVTGSITNPELVGKDNRITYRFVGIDRIDITYRLPNAPADGHETWQRVKLELPE